MKEFYFERTIYVEEKYRVTMSDDMANQTVARKILSRSLANDKPTEAVVLLDSKVIKTGRLNP